MSNILLRTSPVVQKHLSAAQSKIPYFRVGSMVAVHYQYVDGDKKRTQIFKGVVSNIHGAKNTTMVKALDASFTVIKNSVNNIKIERTFPFTSAYLESIEVLELARTKRSNLNSSLHTAKDFKHLRTIKVKEFEAKASLESEVVNQSEPIQTEDKPETELQEE